ncbi:MAG: hypothetical protein ACK56F_04745, partial [bacterium]
MPVIAGDSPADRHAHAESIRPACPRVVAHGCTAAVGHGHGHPHVVAVRDVLVAGAVHHHAALRVRAEVARRVAAQDVLRRRVVDAYEGHEVVRARRR